MPETSPWRMKNTAPGTYFLYRIDDPHGASEEVIHCDAATAKATIARYHRTWHMRREPDPLKRFLFFNCHERRGHRVPLAEFWGRFERTLSELQKEQWSKRMIGERLPSRFPVGPATGNVTSVGNLSFDRRAVAKAQRYRLVGGRLRLN